MKVDEKVLIDEALAGQKNAVAPFSGYKVGAALATAEGKIYRGCNVENCTYALTVCAERVALLTALAAGERKFTSIAVVTRDDKPGTPCGPCRQLLWEYAGDVDVILANDRGTVRRFKLSQLFPEPFEFKMEE